MNKVDSARLWFASFADSRMRGALKRLGRQAKRMDFPSQHIVLFDESALEADFRNSFSDKLIKGSRGYGYWCWKPQVVLQMFKKMSENDILLYLDAGCHLNPDGKKRLEEYIAATEANDIVGFQTYSLLGTPAPDPLHHIRLERELTKGDVFDFFNVRGEKQIYETGQFLGGVFFVKKTSANILFFQKYLDIIHSNWHLIDDSPSLSPNLPGFWAHRHDQSLFSILAKQQGVFSFSSSECEPLLHHAPPEFEGNRSWSRADFDEMREFPIHARRDKTSGLLAYVPITIRRAIRKFFREKYYLMRDLFS